MQGLLITNEFLKTDKFTEHYTWLSGSAKSHGLSLVWRTNADFFLPFGDEIASASRFREKMEKNNPAKQEPGSSQVLTAEEIKKYDFILYWDKDISLGRRISAFAKKFSIPVFNSIHAIELCDDKIATYQRLSEWNQTAEEEDKIPLIPTVMAPMTYSNVGYTGVSFVSGIIEYLGLPMIIKECHGSFGMQVYLANTKEEVYAYTKKLEGIPFLYQKYVKESSGKDVRLQVVGDHVVAGMYRYSEHGDFRANLTNGGSMKPYVASEREKALAVRTVKALGLDFAGVDLLFSKNGTETGMSEDAGKESFRGEADLVCEVNSNAHFKNIYSCTGVNTADCIIEYILGKL